MDGDKEKQGTSQIEDSSTGKPSQTSKEPETYTKEQVEKLKSDALAAAGRDAKAIAEQKKEVQRLIDDVGKARTELRQEKSGWLEKRQEQELETHRDDPDGLKSIQARHRLEAKEAELAKKEQELEDKSTKHQTELSEVAQFKKERNALEIARKYSVDEKKLVKYTDGSIEAMEELAKELPKIGETERVIPKPDSGVNEGGTQVFKRDDILKSIDLTQSPQEIHKQVEELERAAREGRVK